MTDNTTLDAAIEAAGNAIANGRNIVRPVKPTKAQRTYARALIAKLLEGMEQPACPAVVEASQQAYASFCLAYKLTLNDLRKIAGLEVKS